jgi:hypothetical protein
MKKLTRIMFVLDWTICFLNEILYNKTLKSGSHGGWSMLEGLVRMTWKPLLDWAFSVFLLQDPTALALGLDVNGFSEETSTVSLESSTPLKKKCLDMVFEKAEIFWNGHDGPVSVLVTNATVSDHWVNKWRKQLETNHGLEKQEYTYQTMKAPST